MASRGESALWKGAGEQADAGLAGWQMAVAKGASQCPEGAWLVLDWAHEGRSEWRGMGVPANLEWDRPRGSRVPWSHPSTGF